jgi:prepilin-type processing-associated H-X9-DG protein/prepilin-type N-terminal cleavage/methylation domain-containing protein
MDVSQLSNRRRWHAGFTVVELLVGMAIVSLMMAIALPAVQLVRERARCFTCANNARQLSLALANYHDTFQSLPPMQIANMSLIPPDDGLSFLFRFLELPDRYQMVQQGVKRIAFLECPSDPELASMNRPASYNQNVSPGELSGSSARGPFSIVARAVVRFSDISDGLSSSAGFSEEIVIRGYGTVSDVSRQPTRYFSVVEVDSLSGADVTNPYSAARVAQTASSINRCVNGPRDYFPNGIPTMTTWGMAGLGVRYAGYSHWLPPNSPACSGEGYPYGFIYSNRGAASNHSGGVNVSYLDGHVRFVQNGIDLNVWRAAGTIDGNETVSEGF